MWINSITILRGRPALPGGGVGQPGRVARAVRCFRRLGRGLPDLPLVLRGRHHGELPRHQERQIPDGMYPPTLQHHTGTQFAVRIDDNFTTYYGSVMAKGGKCISSKNVSHKDIFFDILQMYIGRLFSTKNIFYNNFF